MSQLLQKSDENILASEYLLNDRQLYNASVHGAYYSSLQRSMYFLSVSLPGSANEQGQEEGNSHNRIINAVEQNLNENGYIADAFDFGQWIRSLKRSRVKADYRKVMFTKSQSSAVLVLAQKLNGILDRLTESTASR